MTEPATEQPATATSPPSAPSGHPPSITINEATSHHQPLQPSNQPFAPIYTLVNNTSTRTTHHPHVRYIFSDDDPDVLTQALADHHETTTVNDSPTGSSGLPGSNSNRAVILDIAANDDGGYHVAWASSLSPSWAVLDAQLSHISPPSSSDGGNENDGGAAGATTNPTTNTNPNTNTNTNTNTNSSNNKPGRLMLRIEGVEGSGSGIGSESGSRHSGETSRHLHGSGSASGGSGTASRERGKALEADDYAVLVDEFEKRMVTLRKVVSANEERLQKVAVEPTGVEGMESQQALEEGAPTTN